jgi:hypothetical protein
MKVKLIEATNFRLKPDGSKAYFNHGKFMLGRFDADEWRWKSIIDERAGLDSLLLQRCGWTPNHILVWDIQTGEGAIFRPGGLASYDLNKHRVWVCPLFCPFLEWLYKQDLSDLDKLPDFIELDVKDAPFALSGYRRPGPAEQDDAQEAPAPEAERPAPPDQKTNESRRGNSRRRDRT